MGRLIDADALDKELEEEAKHCYERQYYSVANGLKVARGIVNGMPTVDAVPVVRCKNCVLNNKGICEFWCDECEEDGFCSFGYAESKGGAE